MMSGNDPIALSIIVGLEGVNWAVQFNHQPRRVAIEIGDKTVNHLLPPKVQPIQPIAAQPRPERTF